jgi:sialate O-acetylesterase
MFRKTLLLLGWVGFVSLRAEVKPNGLFVDNAVLQQGATVPIWGTAREGEAVTVQFGEQKVSTTAQGGKWSVTLKDLKASATPQTLTITGDNALVLKNIVVGEVWLCGGQSNMERQLGLRPPQPPLENWEQEAASADYPLIRHFLVAHASSDKPVEDVKAEWTVCSPQTVAGFSAVGYYFGRDLFKAMNVPVGLIHSSVGGTKAELWTPRTALEANPETKVSVEKYEQEIASLPQRLEQFKSDEPKLLEKYNADVEKAKLEGKPAPRKPAPPRPPLAPGAHYNAMIQPLLPYAIRGVIWYQGEANAGTPKLYRTLLPVLISEWRKVWGQGDFPFLFVQLAPYRGTSPEMRESQLQIWQKTPGTAMTVIVDAGDADNIHPSRKEPVGARLALSARALAYGEKIEYSGPVYDTMKVAGNQAVLSFTHVGSGLQAHDGELKGFTIAGADKVFVPATAVIQGDTVMVNSAAVPLPVAVRYGWINVPDVNLLNKEGLPASPFRTDDWETPNKN